MRKSSVHLLLLTAGALAVGCDASTTPGDDGAAGRPSSVAGSPSAATGGTAAGARGGSTSTGGTGAVGIGGAGAGGTSGTTGNTGGAGHANVGGSPSASGAGPGGGSPSTGGMPGIGGKPSNLGGAGSGAGGATAAGGMPGVAGAKTGGAPGSGGVGLGGAPAAGGASAGMAGAPAEMCDPGSHASTGTKHCGMSDSGTITGNYTYNIYSDGKGSGCMTTYGVDATFSATWSNVGDWIARAGLAFDKTKTYDKIGVFSCDFSYTMTGITTGGFGNVGVYGWSVNPLHEYYIIENWLGKKPAFTVVDTFTIDGEGTYEIQTNTQNNQPNITGTNATFVQFWSVRSSPRQCGHISISKHFDAWAAHGLTLGNLEEARILVEAQNNSGSMDFTTATVVVK